MHAATWNTSRNGDFQPKMDVDVNIDGFIRDVFTTANILHDESRRKLGCVEPMQLVQKDPQTLRNANNDIPATRVRNEGLDHEKEVEKLEEDIAIMVEAPEEPQFGPNHSMFNEASQVPLYEAATLSRLVVVVLLILNCCRTHGINNVFINEMLNVLKMNNLPQPNTLPSSELQHQKF